MAFDGGYRAWRAAVADGLDRGGRRRAGGGPLRRRRARARRRGRGRRRAGARHGAGADRQRRPPARRPRRAESPSRLRANARRHDASEAREALEGRLPPPEGRSLDDELTRLGLRKNHLELAIGDPAVAANFVELRRVTSELADVDEALAPRPRTPGCSSRSAHRDGGRRVALCGSGITGTDRLRQVDRGAWLAGAGSRGRRRGRRGAGRCSAPGTPSSRRS